MASSSLFDTATLSQHWSHDEDSLVPPFPETRSQINPSLLVSWWCTIFATVIIFIRLGGRWFRTERLFTEDKFMALAIVPLIVRMICVHYVLLDGTNNVVITNLTPDDISKRVIGSKLVLAARIFYAMFLWITKWTIADFLHRIYSQMWTRRQDLALQGIKWLLVITYCGVFISTLSECQPFDNYWQVVPDPGPSCRCSYIQLITMGVMDSLTDILLVVFPLPIIITSNMKLDRKISLSLLFSMSLILVGIAIFRVQSTIENHYSQRYRSLLASFEILAATGVSNAIVLGSFLRDRGIKKNKFKQSSTGHDSVLDRPNNVLLSARSHPSTHPAQVVAATTLSRSPRHVRGLNSWGSDEDLAGELGMRLGPEFHAEKQPRLARPAPAALALVPLGRDGKSLGGHHRRAKTSEGGIGLHRGDLGSDDDEEGEDNDDDYDDDDSSPPSPKSSSPRGVDFFDVGGLLDNRNGSPTKTRSKHRRKSSVSFAPLPSPSSNAPLISAGGGSMRRDSDGDDAASLRASTGQQRMPMERFGIGGGGSGGGSKSDVPLFHLPGFSGRRHDERKRY